MLLQEEQHIVRWLTQYGALAKTQVIRLLRDQPPDKAERIIRRLKRELMIYDVAGGYCKGKEDATKKLVQVPIDENGSVPHDLTGKFGSASVLIKRAPEGTGIIAGGPARSVLELAGYKNIRTKSLGSNNKQNVVLAAIEGLKNLKTPEEVAKARGISVKGLLE